MIKFLPKGGYLSPLTVAHCLLYVEITCGVNEKQLVSDLTFIYARKKHRKVTYLNWKANRKEHPVETLYKLSSDNVYLLFVSFFRVHENFGLN